MINQLSLFTEPETKPSRIIGLHSIKGLNYHAGFLRADEQVSILAGVDAQEWQHDLKRRVQHYGYKYDYRARKVDHSMFVGPLPEFAVRMGERLVEAGIVQDVPDQLIVNEYLPGQGITPHIDCEPCFRDTIVTISLGCTYPMDFYSTQSDDVYSHDLEAGSVLVLSEEARYRWKHGIKPRKTDNGRKRQRRVSLTFRNVILTGDGDGERGGAMASGTPFEESTYDRLMDRR